MYVLDQHGIGREDCMIFKSLTVKDKSGKDIELRNAEVQDGQGIISFVFAVFAADGTLNLGRIKNGRETFKTAGFCA